MHLDLTKTLKLIKSPNISIDCWTIAGRQHILTYFEALGYICPPTVDLADFLQELPTPEGHRFITTDDSELAARAPRNTEAFVAAWRASDLYKQLNEEVEESISNSQTIAGTTPTDALETGLRGPQSNDQQSWPKELKELYAGSYFYHFKLVLQRSIKVIRRDSLFLKARIAQNLVVGAIAGSLFSNIKSGDSTTMNGFLFFSVLFNAIGNFSMMNLSFQQKSVYYKHADALFFPTSAFTLAQSLVLLPLQCVEAIIFTTIMYWSAGLSQEHYGSRYLTFLIIVIVFTLVMAQFFRLIAAIGSDENAAAPIAGVFNVLMVLFSGFIQPYSQISYGWRWFYWISPFPWALKAVTINEFLSDQYDKTACADPPVCSHYDRLGHVVLKANGVPTDPEWIWYSVLVLVADYLFLLLLTTMAMKYLRVQPTPPPPAVPEVDREVISTADQVKDLSELPFDPITMAFKDIWYTVKLPGSKGEHLDVLRGVSGYFEPGKVTALMGSTG